MIQISDPRCSDLIHLSIFNLGADKQIDFFAFFGDLTKCSESNPSTVTTSWCTVYGDASDIYYMSTAGICSRVSGLT